VRELCGSYLENRDQSYGQTAAPGKCVIGYQQRPGRSTSEERRLHPSTLWRTLTWLGSQLAAFNCGLRLLAQSDPNSDCHRFLGAVPPRKFRSPPRGKKLRNARRLLHLIDQWERHFQEPFFPRFATRSGFD
jgi:hypothetical protein